MTMHFVLFEVVETKGGGVIITMCVSKMHGLAVASHCLLPLVTLTESPRGPWSALIMFHERQRVSLASFIFIVGGGE